LIRRQATVGSNRRGTAEVNTAQPQSSRYSTASFSFNSITEIWLNDLWSDRKASQFFHPFAFVWAKPAKQSLNFLAVPFP
jgi:hypothetical protein